MKGARAEVPCAKLALLPRCGVCSMDQSESGAEPEEVTYFLYSPVWSVALPATQGALYSQDRSHLLCMA